MPQVIWWGRASPPTKQRAERFRFHLWTPRSRQTGTWIADYVRLRCRAVLTQERATSSERGLCCLRRHGFGPGGWAREPQEVAQFESPGAQVTLQCHAEMVGPHLHAQLVGNVFAHVLH
jgi:hypothetical protein